MFNNYTGEKEYESCNIIVEATQATGPLLIGDFNSATDEETLQAHKIKTVITAAAGLEHLEIPEFVTHVVYPLKDAKSQNIRLYFDESYQTIEQNLQHGGVLVHCAAGVSRSATIVIAYLMRKNSLTFQAAIQVVRKQRSGVCPNLGFELQLKQYGSDLEKSVPSIKKNGSKRLSDNINLQHDHFEPVNSSKYSSKKKVDPKKTVSKAFGHSRPKQKLRFQGDETELFVSGKSAKRPTSQIKQGEKIKKSSKHVMMQTWGIPLQKAKQF